MSELGDLDAAVDDGDWDALRERLAAWSDDDTRDAAVQHAAGLVASWPDVDLAASGDDWQAILDGAEPPVWWPLVRHLTLDAHQYLDPIEPLRGLRSLDATQSRIELEPLAELPRLEALSIAELAIEDLELLRPLTQLAELEVIGCDELTDISAIEAMPKLRSLSLAACRGVTSLAPVASCPHLLSLDVRGTQQVDSLAPVARLDELTALVLQNCPWVDDLSPLAQLDALRQLGLDGCGNITSLAPLAGLTGLEELTISQAQLGDVDALRGLASLDTVALRELAGVTELPAIPAAGSLVVERMPALARVALPIGEPRQVRIAQCAQLVAITGHDDAHAPTSLALQDVGVRDLSFLRNVDALELLSVSGAPALVDLGGLSAVQSLTHLILTYCDAISDLSPLAMLTQLETLDLKHCAAIRDLRPILNLPALSLLDITGCNVDRSVLANARFRVVG